MNEELAHRYLDLLKLCLTRLLFISEEVRDFTRFSELACDEVDAARLQSLLAERGLRLVEAGGDPSLRALGQEWPLPQHADTMVGLARLDNVQACVADVVARGVPGDLIEAGTWRGGVTVLMRAVLAALGDEERRVWVADSFEGVPRANAQDYPADGGLEFISELTELTASVEDVQRTFSRYGLLDDRVRFLPGWFKDTLPQAPTGPLAVIRIDGDLYESTMDALTALYPRLSVGGYLIVDDYHDIPACRRAVSDYRVTHSIREKVHTVDWTAIYWQRSE